MTISQAMLATLEPREREFFVEEWVERQIDRIDNAFCAGKLTQSEYQARMAEVTAAAEEAYKVCA